jgi:RNA polymerase-binding transcription factor DksA
MPALDPTQLKRFKSELDARRAALEQEVNGTFGICIDCGQAIDGVRLKHNPAAGRCTGCQARREFAGKDRTPSL